MDQLIAVLVGAVGPSGALIWYMYHTTTKTIPELVEAHRREIACLVEAFRVDIKEERELRRTLLQSVLERAPFICPHAKSGNY